MSKYLDLLTQVGPSPEDLARKQKEMAAEQAAKEKAIREGAKEEINDLQGRVSELRKDPNKTYNKPYDSDDFCCEEHIQKFQEVWDMGDEYDCAVNEVALILMKNSEDEAEATQGYTKQMHNIKELLKVSLECIKHLTKKLNKPEGPENKPGKDEADIKARIEHYQKVADWCSRNAIATQEKIKDELNHNTLLLAEYIEFTGITPMPDGLKQATTILVSQNPAEKK